MKTLPQWTVYTQFTSPESEAWCGTSWEFFKEQADALECYKRHESLGQYPTMRPFDKNDVRFMCILDAMKVG